MLLVVVMITLFGLFALRLAQAVPMVVPVGSLVGFSLVAYVASLVLLILVDVGTYNSGNDHQLWELPYASGTQTSAARVTVLLPFVFALKFFLSLAIPAGFLTFGAYAVSRYPGGDCGSRDLPRRTYKV